MLNEEILKAIEACALAKSAHVIDVAVRGSKNRTIVEVFVDAESGMTSDLCSEVSRDVAEIFEQRNVFKGSYDLVVSSPGITRPLKFVWQYKKHLGRNFALTLVDGVKCEGKLLELDNEGATIESGKDHNRMHVRFDAIREAIVKAPW